jgi:zinc transport system substrate-binding protein
MRIILILAVALLAGCGGAASTDKRGASGENRLDVVAAFYPLAYAADWVGGAAVSVTNLTPPGAEPHDVELSARDVERVRSADVVLYLGSGFQPALERVVEGARGEAIDLLGGRDLTATPADDEPVDPHVWLDPVRYARIVERIGAALERREAAAELAADVRELHAAFRQGLRVCARRELVTSHAAFGYLAARYRLEQIALSGLSPEAEPSPRRLERLIDEVREQGATTVFFETLVAPDVAETVAREAGARTAVLNPLEGLTEAELRRGEDYFSVMRANLATLREALACR